MSLLRQAEFDLREKEIDNQIKKEQQRRNSWEISDEEYDLRYNGLIQKYELLVRDLLDNNKK